MLDYLTRSQIQKLHSLAGDRNAIRVMQSLEEYVSCFRAGENVYYLNKKGRERVGSDIVRTKLGTVEHYLMRNDLYISKKPQLFIPEQRIKVGDLTIVTDAIMQPANSLRHLVEIDNIQKMLKNEEKIRKYRLLKETKAFQEQYGYFPRLVWVTKTESRLKRLKELCEGLDTVIYLWEDIR